MDSITTPKDKHDDSDGKESFKMPTLPGPRLKKKANLISPVDNEESRPFSTPENTSSDNVSTNEENEPFSPAEKLRQSEMSSNFFYREPTWGGIGEDSGKYTLEVIKDGTKIDDISLLGKSMYVFGRLQSCDHQMDHPSISRYHAVLQYRPKNSDAQAKSDSKSLVGWYLYDLDSTHGTWVNKQRIQPEVFIRLRVGYVIKFGGSTRLFVMDGPTDDCDQETEMSFAEMTRMKNEAKLVQKMKEMAENEENKKEVEAEAFRKRNEFCSWGMEDDAIEEDPDGDNPFAEQTSTDESLYIEDPKKSIRCFFEREGLDAPEYEFVDDGSNFGIGTKKKCRLELPVDSSDGKPVYVEVPVDGKRKEATVACALEACRMLDKMGLLRKATHESRSKRKRRNWAENDYYDSDEDSFFDRTGDLERKRAKRMKKEMPDKSETHESLTAKLADVVKEMNEIETSLAEDERMNKEALKEDDGECDELDAFMKTVKLGGLGVRAKMTMKSRLIELKHLRAKLESLVAISKPCEIKINPTRKVPSMFGKVSFSKLNIPKPRPAMSMEMSANEEPETEQEEEGDMRDPPHLDSEKVTNKGILPGPEEVKAKTEVEQQHHSSSVSTNKDSRSLPKASNPCQIKKKNRKINGPTNSPELPPFEKPSPLTYGPVRDLPELKAIECPDEEESVWLPPEDQSGDGRTKLNDKYGY